MVHGGDAAKAIRLAPRIVHELGARHGFPSVRVGMHTGPAVERGGDWCVRRHGQRGGAGFGLGLENASSQERRRDSSRPQDCPQRARQRRRPQSRSRRWPLGSGSPRVASRELRPRR